MQGAETVPTATRWGLVGHVPYFVRRALHLVLGEEGFEALLHRYYANVVKNEGYDRKYYEYADSFQDPSYPVIAETVMAEFQPGSIIDAGCGSGGVAEACLANGCEEVYAFDSSVEAVEMASERGVRNVVQIDLTKVARLPAKADLCLCLEVAEHIPERHAGRLCELLSGASPTVLFTAATPGQGGYRHFNERPRGYWIDIMKAFSMAYDADSVERVRRGLRGRVMDYYDKNLMVFRKLP